MCRSACSFLSTIVVIFFRDNKNNKKIAFEESSHPGAIIKPVAAQYTQYLRNAQFMYASRVLDTGSLPKYRFFYVDPRKQWKKTIEGGKGGRGPFEQRFFG